MKVWCLKQTSYCSEPELTLSSRYWQELDNFWNSFDDNMFHVCQAIIPSGHDSLSSSQEGVTVSSHQKSPDILFPMDAGNKELKSDASIMKNEQPCVINSHNCCSNISYMITFLCWCHHYQHISILTLAFYLRHSLKNLRFGHILHLILPAFVANSPDFWVFLCFVVFPPPD